MESFRNAYRVALVAVVNGRRRRFNWECIAEDTAERAEERARAGLARLVGDVEVVKLRVDRIPEEGR